VGKVICYLVCLPLWVFVLSLVTKMEEPTYAEVSKLLEKWKLNHLVQDFIGV